MSFVLDASVSAAWAFEDETHPHARRALARASQEAAHVPALWWFELRNVLIVNERRGRGSADSTKAFLMLLSGLKIGIDTACDEAQCMALARRHRLTLYDAAYLELAMRRNIAIATLDRALASAAQAEMVPIVGETA